MVIELLVTRDPRWTFLCSTNSFKNMFYFYSSKLGAIQTICCICSLLLEGWSFSLILSCDREIIYSGAPVLVGSCTKIEDSRRH